MEFKYRAVDVDRPATAMASSSSGFLSEQPILGCNIRLPSEPTGKPTEDRVWEAIRREIEKEHIRQEIIAAENARRRELVAEVIREMATEREMAMRRGTEMGVSFEERLTTWINFRKSPNQNGLFEQHHSFSDPLRCTGPYSLATSQKVQLPQLEHISDFAGAKAISVPESNKDKLIILDRPDSKEAKRKAEASPAADPEGYHLLSLKKKPREEWSCTICKVSATCERGLNEHIQGKRHKAKEAALRAKQMSKSSRVIKARKEVSSKSTCLEQVESEKQMETAEKIKTKSKIKYWCEICNVGTSSKAVMRKHELGKKHKARILQQKEHPEAAPTSLATASLAITVPPSNAVIETRVEDVVSQKKKFGDAILEGASMEGQRVDEVVVDGTTVRTEFERKQKFKFWCEICNIGTFSKGLMNNHRLGKKHKARLEKQHNGLVVLNTELTSLFSHTRKLAATSATTAATAIPLLPLNVALEEKVWPALAENEKAEDAVAKETRIEDHTAYEAVVGGQIVEEVKGEYSSVEKLRIEDPTAEKRTMEEWQRKMD